MSKYYRKGKVAPSNLKHLKQLSRERHKSFLEALPIATETSWDSRTQGWVGAVKDQGDCGSCWDFSGTGACEIAFNKAGVGTVDQMILSEEYTLSCGSNGGCNGDDNTTVLDWAKTTGLPLSADYGPYDAQADTCQYNSGMRLFKIDDWGFADTSDEQGVANTQSIKNAIKAYGCVGAAIAADGPFENNPAGMVFQGSGYTQINHDIILIGWDDNKGAWLLRNSWGPDWCDSGYCWIAYGANEVGTEAVFAIVNDVNPPTPTPTPTPPTPTPVPVPPGPNNLVQDMDKLFADIELRFSDQPMVIAGLEVAKYILDSYLASLKSK